MKKILSALLSTAIVFSFLPDKAQAHKEATQITAKANNSWYERLDFADEREVKNALRGCIEMPEQVVIKDEAGRVLWSVEAYGDLKGKAPAEANPSLWRNTALNAYAGLFEVCEGIYQVRGYDMANATFIRTDHGWVVFDVLMCEENMRAALALMEKHFGPIDIKGVLYSHSHVDHFGGILGLIGKDQIADPSLSLVEQVKSGKVPILAPKGFLEHAVSENIYAGGAMARRAQYQYGSLLPKGKYGALSVGIGLGQSIGQAALLAPTYEVTENMSSVNIDGLEIQFQLTPGTEAPAEMNAYFPAYKALWMAENCTGTLHNLYTLRGAEIRNAKDWSKYILEAEKLFGDKTKVIFQSHNWPHWEEAQEYMVNTASMYKFIHDQTLHYINQGYTPNEIAHMLKLPEKLEGVWYTRQYYGTLIHNSKAVYQKYMGWYDANPVSLNALPPEENAKKLVAYLGDTDKVLEKARRDFEAGEYQWVAQITRELVFADPTNKKARELCADALEQLGYQAESGAWRNAYLMGASELRKGNMSSHMPEAGLFNDNMESMSLEMLFDYLAIMTDANAAQDEDVSLNFLMSDTGEKYYVTRRNGVLLTYPGENNPRAEATVHCTVEELVAAMMGGRLRLNIEGDEGALYRLLKYAQGFRKNFNIIEP